jgi:hypothetical protein
MKVINTVFPVLAGLLLLAGITAFLTKPSDSACKKSAADLVAAHAQNNKQNKDVRMVSLNQQLNESGTVTGIRVTDHVFYKKITITLDGSTRDLGWAAFGKVKVGMTDNYVQ